MECPSCYEYFDGETRVPRNLNCGHTFCEMCLVKIEQQRLTFCPLCKTNLQKPFKAKKLPKNYLALEYASKHHEMMKNSNFCQVHPKELMRHFCITCVSLICMECIVDHSGHEFVRKDESGKFNFDLYTHARCLIDDTCLTISKMLVSFFAQSTS